MTRPGRDVWIGVGLAAEVTLLVMSVAVMGVVTGAIVWLVLSAVPVLGRVKRARADRELAMALGWDLRQARLAGLT